MLKKSLLILRDQVKGSSPEQLIDLMNVERIVERKYLDKVKSAQKHLNYARKRTGIIQKELNRRSDIDE